MNQNAFTFIETKTTVKSYTFCITF